MPKTKGSKSKIVQTSLSKDFYSDIDFENLLVAAIIRSPVSSGTFTGFNEEQIPEGYNIFSAKDIPNTNVVKILKTQIPLFCNGEIRYKGEPLGILVGPDKEVIQEIQDTLEIYIESKESTSEESPNTGKVIQEKVVKTGLALENTESFENLFSTSDKTFKEKWHSIINPTSFSETEGVVCNIRNGNLQIFTPTTWISNLRKVVSFVLEFESSKIAINKTKLQPYSVNGNWQNTLLVAQTALATLKTGKPVKLSFSEEEQQKYIEGIIPAEFTYRSALNSSGEITAMSIEIDIDLGAENPFYEEIMDRMIISSCSIYNTKNLYIKAVVHTSNKPPYSPKVEDLSAQAFYAAESQLNCISEIFGILPQELRITNINLDAKKNYMPFKFSLKNPEETINAVIRESDFNRKFTSYRIDSQIRQKSFLAMEDFSLRGIGLASAYAGAGYPGSGVFFGKQKIEATLESDAKLTIHALPPSSSILSIWKETAADIMDIKLSDITLNSSFEEENEPPLPESAYSNLGIMIQLLKKCCTAIQNKRFRNPLPITVSKTVSPTQKKQWDFENFTGKPFQSMSFASAVVELELDPCTFKCSLRGLWLVIDGGKILMESSAQNAINLEVNRTLCGLFGTEKLDCAKVSINFIHSQEEAKQIQGLVANTIPAAFASALSQAISETVKSLPADAENLFKKGAFRPEEFLDTADDVLEVLPEETKEETE